MASDQFLSWNQNVEYTWSNIIRLTILKVYGEEHRVDEEFDSAIEELKFHDIAKRKLFNPLKIPEFILTLFSDLVDGMLAEKSLFNKFLSILKSMIVDLPLGIMRRVTSPANTIFRPLNNLRQKSLGRFALLMTGYALIVAGYILANVLSGGSVILGLGAGSLIAYGIKGLFGTSISAPTMTAITVCSNAAVTTALTAKGASIVQPENTKSNNENRASQSLYNSSENSDTFQLEDMTTKYAVLSFFGADPVCPRQPTIISKSAKVVKRASLLVRHASLNVGHVAKGVQGTAQHVAVAASAAAAMMPAALNTACGTVAGVATGAVAMASAVAASAGGAAHMAGRVEKAAGDASRNWRSRPAR